MKKLCLLFLLFLGTSSWAQFTTVSGTVTDPNGLPYANGTITSTLVISGTATFTSGGSQYLPPTQPVGLSSTGSFVMQLADVTALSPGGGTWSFQVCSAIGTVQPAFGKGPVCFTVNSIVISGVSQNIGATLTAAALALTATFGGGGGNVSGTGTFNFLPLWNGSHSLINSVVTQNTSGAVVGIGMPAGAAASSSTFAVFQVNGIIQQQAGTQCSNGTGIPLGSAAVGCTGAFVSLANLSAGDTNAMGTVAGLTVQNIAPQNTTALLLGVEIQAGPSGGPVTEVRGLEVDALPNSSATITTNRGIVTSASSINAGTTATQQALYVLNNASVAGTVVTNDSGIFVDSPNIANATLTHHYGIFIADQTVSGTGTNSDSHGVYVAGGGVQTAAHAFATLPTCNATNEGRMEAITDSTTAVWGATITGTGANHVLGYCDGAAWTVAAK